MEFPLVRSGMNVQRTSNPERRDAIQFSNHAGTPRPRRRTGRGQSRGVHRIARLHESYRSLCEDVESVHEEVLPRAPSSSSELNEFISSKLSDGYAHVAAQLQLFQGSKNKINLSKPPPWELVAQVVCLVDEPVCCPICLYPPVAPRMERCGHIYCAPCVAQYVRYGNDCTTKKCAVCSWIFKLEDLRRVNIIHVSPLKVGSKVSMQLVDYSNYTQSAESSGGLSMFTSVVEIADEQLRLENRNEISLLEAYKMACMSDGDVELVSEINYMVGQLEAAVVTQRNSLRDASSTLVDCASEMLFRETDEQNMNDREKCQSSTYQAVDGQLIFLDGLMWKCLLVEYGSVFKLPKFLEVTVTSVKSYKMNPLLRRRWRHLDRIPSGRMFRLIEIELDSLVSRETLEQFASALEARNLERTRNRLEDLRLTKLKEAAENRIPFLPEGFVLSGHAPLSSGPSFQPSEFVPLGGASEVDSKILTSSPSFAEVSRMGASAVVDHNRVANFTRGPPTRRSTPSFNLSNEYWPSLSVVESSSTARNHSPFRDDSSPHWDHPSNTTLPQSSSLNLEQPENVAKSHSKKRRKRRTRTRSLHDSTPCD